MGKLIRVDIISDTVCPWCYVGKRRLEAAIRKFKEAGHPDAEFEVRWHPFQLNPTASSQGVNKRQYYHQKFGARAESLIAHMTNAFASEGLEYNMDGLTGNTLQSHQLIALAGQEGLRKQDDLVESLFKAYFTEGKFINDREVLLNAAQKCRLESPDRAFDKDSSVSKQVSQELQSLPATMSGVPHFTIDDKYQLSGAQDPSAFVEIFSRV